MTTRVYIEPDFPNDGLRIHLSRKHGPEQISIARFGNVSFELITDARVVDNDAQPLRLRENDARALYEALAHHFGGHPETASLRKDYEAERARVDKFITHLTVRSNEH